jgi:deoxyribose-phosphate aldolase
MLLTRDELASIIDHTLLKPETTHHQAMDFVDQGVDLGVHSVCLSPSLLPINPRGLKLTVVCGFPSGAHATSIKAAEAAKARALGADEIDMVINLGRAKAHDWAFIRSEIAVIRVGVPAPTVLKVIIESAALTDEEIVAACHCAAEAGADFVKTSTGFHPAGGASTHAVALMRRTVGDDLGVKASGGIRTLVQAEAMIEAGATRLGLSASASILAEAEAQMAAPDYTAGVSLASQSVDPQPSAQVAPPAPGSGSAENDAETAGRSADQPSTDSMDLFAEPTDDAAWVETDDPLDRLVEAGEAELAASRASEPAESLAETVDEGLSESVAGAPAATERRPAAALVDLVEAVDWIEAPVDPASATDVAAPEAVPSDSTDAAVPMAEPDQSSARPAVNADWLDGLGDLADQLTPEELNEIAAMMAEEDDRLQAQAFISDLSAQSADLSSQAVSPADGSTGALAEPILATAAEISEPAPAALEPPAGWTGSTELSLELDELAFSQPVRDQSDGPTEQAGGAPAATLDPDGGATGRQLASAGLNPEQTDWEADPTMADTASADQPMVDPAGESGQTVDPDQAGESVPVTESVSESGLGMPATPPNIPDLPLAAARARANAATRAAAFHRRSSLVDRARQRSGAGQAIPSPAKSQPEGNPSLPIPSADAPASESDAE